MKPAPPVELAARSIDEVIDRLTWIVDWAKNTRSRIGYFAALYRSVTIQIRDEIRREHLDDAQRMERFVVVFANRYLEAVALLRRGASLSRVWAFAFKTTDSYWPIVLQHLLLGMNAHINLDLGIAAAQIMKGADLEGLHADFDRINGILAARVDDVQNELAHVWTALRVFNGVLGNIDDELIKFSIQKARDEAWRSAERLWNAPEADWPSVIDTQDKRMMVIARLVRRPEFFLTAVMRIVRIGEVQNVSRVINILTSRNNANPRLE
jgi:hypothetical protein